MHQGLRLGQPNNIMSHLAFEIAYPAANWQSSTPASVGRAGTAGRNGKGIAT